MASSLFRRRRLILRGGPSAFWLVGFRDRRDGRGVVAGRSWI